MAKFLTSRNVDIAIAGEARAYLHARFPKCFSAKGKEKRPLKIGIDKDLFAAGGIPGWAIWRALQDYTSGPMYRRAMVEGAERIDLNGEPVGAVTASEAQSARDLLANMNAKRAA